MKAALIEKHGTLVVKDIAEPAVGDYDALCELLYGATCTGTDSHIIDGTFPWISPLPTVLGHESVGRVITLGKKVRNFKVGDLVTRVGTPPSPDKKFSITWGGFAELGVAKDHWAMAADGLPAQEWNRARVNQVVPTGVDPQVAPMYTTWRETLSYIQRIGVSAGKSVLVAGSGGNGLAFAAHAVNLGATVAMAGAARLGQAVKTKARVEHYYDYTQDDLAMNIKNYFPEGFDYVIDAVGAPGTADGVLSLVKNSGTICIYGIDDANKVVLHPRWARGTFSFRGPGPYDEAETHQQVSEYVLQGKLDATLWYDLSKIAQLDGIADAYEAVRKRVAPKVLVQLKK
ncbi:MAG: zinc-binding dehydrogenase [Spirochaetota bacterium]